MTTNPPTGPQPMSDQLRREESNYDIPTAISDVMFAAADALDRLAAENVRLRGEAISGQRRVLALSWAMEVDEMPDFLDAGTGDDQERYDRLRSIVAELTPPAAALAGHGEQDPPARPSLAAALAEIHKPYTEIAEFYCFNDGRDDEWGCPSYDECAGHELPIEVCQECGHTAEDDRIMYRAWPCPTARLAADAPERAGEPAEPGGVA